MAPPQDEAQSLALIHAYRAEQMAMSQQRQALLSQKATEEQLAAWRQQNAGRFAAQRQRADALAAASVQQPLPAPTSAAIPEGASQNLKDFLATRATLVKARAELHNQLVQELNASGQPIDSNQLAQREEDAAQIMRQRYSSLLQLQSQRMQAIAAEAAASTVPAPPNLVVPEGLPTKLSAYLSARNQLIKDRALYLNQYSAADRETRQAAFKQWNQQNAARVQAVQNLAQDLTESEQSAPNPTGE